MTEPPKFLVKQPDGREVLVDLSAPGAWGDFSFRVITVASQRVDYFDAYHTGEATIFLDVLHSLVHDRPREHILDDVERIRADVRERATDLTATTISENSFEWLLPRVPGMLVETPTATGYRATDSGRLTLEPSTEALRFAARDNPPSPTDPHVAIPVKQLWQFAAGMIWRSYSDNQSAAPMLTRLCTAAYDAALTAFEVAVRESP